MSPTFIHSPLPQDFNKKFEEATNAEVDRHTTLKNDRISSRTAQVGERQSKVNSLEVQVASDLGHMNDAKAFFEDNASNRSVLVEVKAELDADGEEVVASAVDDVYDAMEDLAEGPGGRDAADDESMNCDAGSL